MCRRNTATITRRSDAGLPGAQIDVTRGKVDGRLQFANSSPANPRSLFAHDQYGNWAGGAGYTIRQGFRVGVDGYRGPYLDRHYAYSSPERGISASLPATGLGINVQWSHNHTGLQFEEDRFLMTYAAIPDYRVGGLSRSQTGSLTSVVSRLPSRLHRCDCRW